MSGYDDLLASVGMDHEEFAGELAKLMEMHVLAQKAHMAFVQRCGDLEIPPTMGMLAIYQIARLQVKANMAEGVITPREIHGSKMLMEMLMELRHPDGKTPRLRMDANNNFQPDGTYSVTP